ncbi:DUF222 domain-containing protein [Tsukamurella sp. 8F]|uniref:HNH endonuclease n=1 Tax=unclassified Tsukamurella TaxID=2633480 RepID=UPI0023B98163|nr:MULTISPECIES: HNH endonuclease signature motif containing protein [unclassified Tsukamurella]MDF0528676.1 DUF222 domain-containing protein [Tsukamurella sp. 8J]MDF0585638.1 DUF222 domain-containing protein [Tsukamurella sp. 8F]
MNTVSNSLENDSTSTGVVAARVALLADPLPDGDVELLQRIGELEQLRSLVGAEMSRALSGFRDLRVAERAARGIAPDRRELGVAHEVGQAMGASPHRASSALRTAKALCGALRHTMARLTAGELSPERAHAVVVGTSHLDDAERRQADERLCADSAVLDGLGTARTIDAVRRVSYELDPEGTLARWANAAKDRHVSIRPVPDGLVRISVLLPTPQGVGLWAALGRAADQRPCDGRTHAQFMADTAYERIAGRPGTAAPPVHVNLTVSDAVLVGDAAGTGFLADGGGLPGEIARRLVAEASEDGLAWLRRLYVTPETGAVVAMDSRARTVPEGMARLIRARDQYCRTPYCDARIQHIDHVHPAAEAGETSVDNGQGLCRACNFAKEADGWSARPVADATGRHTVETTMTSGVGYRSTAPRQAPPAAA